VCVLRVCNNCACSYVHVRLCVSVHASVCVCLCVFVRVNTFNCICYSAETIAKSIFYLRDCVFVWTFLMENNNREKFEKALKT